MIFAPTLPPRARLTLGADASATTTTLTRETERSEMLMLTHHSLLDAPSFSAAAPLVDLGHLRGDANLASDCVSRAEWKAFFRLCSNLRIRPHQLQVPAACRDILHKVLALAQHRGVPVRLNNYLASAPAVPETTFFTSCSRLLPSDSAPP